jgi:sensor histidine kinase YesM
LKQDKNISLYWKCQLLGWALAGLFWSFSAWVQLWQTGSQGAFSFVLAGIHFAFDVVIGVMVTHGYYLLAHKYAWVKLKLKQMPLRLIPALLMMGLVYTLFTVGKLYLLRFYFSYGFDESFAGFFMGNFLTVFAGGTRVLAIWVLIFHLYHYATMEIRIAEDNARLQTIARDAQLQQLSAQLNPHFFFNSLNSVKALISINPVKARRAIDLLSELLRSSLYQNSTELIPLQQEIGLVNDYLELEKIRFEERLQYRIDIDEELKNLSILPLSIQTLVENAIKHGIAQQKDGGMVIIAIKKQDDRVNISVENSGTIIPKEMQGLGLRNLDERLKLHYAGNYSLSLKAMPGDKVLATFNIPVL